MAVRIDNDWCINCHRCRRVCPTDAILYISGTRRTHVVEAMNCLDCDRCIPVCPARCIRRDPSYAGARAGRQLRTRAEPVARGAGGGQ